MTARTIAATLALWASCAAADGLWITIREPADGAPAVGEIEVAAEVVSVDDVLEVEFLVDGRPAGVLLSPPYAMPVDLGADLVGHTITAVARDRAGREVAASVTTTAVPVAASFDLELQQLYVTVTDGDGARMGDLEREAFVVRDEGRTQELVTFAHGDLPFTAVLALDASTSMAGPKLTAAAAGVQAFVTSLRPLDQAQVLVFSDQLLSLGPVGGAGQALTIGLAGVRAAGGTAVADHLYAAAKMLQQRQGRRVVVLLSDGIDSHSVLAMEQTIDAIRRSQALLYWIRLGRESTDERDDLAEGISSAWREPAEYRRNVRLLQDAVTASGGRIVPVQRTEEIEGTFLQILEELRDQYALGYYPTSSRNDGTWHPVSVTVADRSLKVRAAAGYVDLE